MKSPLPFLALLAFITALLAFRVKEFTVTKKEKATYPSLNKKNSISCSPDWEFLQPWLEEANIPPIPGSGTHQWKISTSSDSAQYYFNQGINMYYAFHIIEAMASFRKATKFDPNSAMLYWAQALAYGPNINDIGYAASPEALTAIGQAVELTNGSNIKEKMLIAAQQVRYSADSTQTREKLNQLYVDKMREAYEAFPDDPDIAALYADALMLQHPWDLWSIDGTPKAWTPLIMEILEKILAKTPDHTGANHYYIHVMEPSPYAIKAKPSADRLGRLTPALSHTVHMPSHIYLRTGEYKNGVLVNEKAVASYKTMQNKYTPVSGNDFLYVIHNLHMQTNHAMMTGSSSSAMRSAKQTAESIPKEYLSMQGAMGNYLQYIYMTPVIADVRYGNWNSLLAMQKTAKEMIYANLLYHFGRGMAFANQNKLPDAKVELEHLQALVKDSTLELPFLPFSPAVDGGIVAENILIGTIALKEKKYSDAVAAFEEAVVTEENMVYNEPRDWMLNPKHYLGNALIKARRTNEAKEILMKDLLNNNENGWALFGLWQAYTIEKKPAEANKMLNRFRKAFDKADVKLYGPVF